VNLQNFSVIFLIVVQEKCEAVASSPALLNLIQLGTQLHNIPVPASAKRGILKALVMVGSAQDDQTFRDEYWSQVQYLCIPLRFL
jgi:hypothetical protein